MAVFTHDTPMSGRATTDAVSVSMVAGDATSQMRVQYGLTDALGSWSDTVTASASDERLIVELSSLAAGTVYYYQVGGKLEAGEIWSPIWPIQQTKTAAAPGTAGRAGFWSDPHITKQLTEPDFNPDLESRYTAFLAHVAGVLPDFYASLGDELVSIGGQWPDIGSQADMDAWWALWRDFTYEPLTLRPFYFVDGNHEQRCGYRMEPAEGEYNERWSTISEKRYLLNPADGENDATLAWKGDETGEKVGGASEGNVNPLENYYTWSDGDADFFAVTQFRYTRIGEASGPADRSQWTLGAEQLAWLVAALAASTARWKIVCSHHVIGSNSDEGPYGRCGTADVLDDGHYMTDTGDGEGLHAKMVAGGVTHFVKGHDHLAACGQVGPICYVTCPSPSALIGGPGKSAYGYETEDFWLKDYGWVELAWAPHQFVVKMHHLAYDESFNITDTVVHTDVQSDLAPKVPGPTIWQGVSCEDSGVSVLGHVVGHDGASAVQADLATIHRSIYNTATGDVVEGDTALTVADVVFDVLQTDARWGYDSVGFNFCDPVPAVKFASGDAMYRLEYRFTPVDGEAWHGAFEVAAAEMTG